MGLSTTFGGMAVSHINSSTVFVMACLVLTPKRTPATWSAPRMYPVYPGIWPGAFGLNATLSLLVIPSAFFFAFFCAYMFSLFLQNDR